MTNSKENTISSASADKKKIACANTQDKNETLKKIMENYHSGDEVLVDQAKKDMLKETEKFISFMINKHFRTYSEKYHADLFNEGVIAVLENMGNFDAEKGKLSTYFTAHLLHYMYAFINQEVNRTTPYYSNIIKKVKNSQKKFETMEIVPTAADISYDIGESVKKVEDALRQIKASNEISFETESEFDAHIKQQTESPETILLRNENQKHLTDALVNHLSPLDRKIIELRFGLEDNDEMSFINIAKVVKIPVNQVRMSITKSLKILKNCRELEEFKRTPTQRAAYRMLNSANISPVSEDMLNVYSEIGNNSYVQEEKEKAAQENNDSNIYITF